MMTKKDFNEIAEILKKNGLRFESVKFGCGFLVHIELYESFLDDLGSYFKTQNPKFDKIEFKEVCLI